MFNVTVSLFIWWCACVCRNQKMTWCHDDGVPHGEVCTVYSLTIDCGEQKSRTFSPRGPQVDNNPKCTTMGIRSPRAESATFLFATLGRSRQCCFPHGLKGVHRNMNIWGAQRSTLSYLTMMCRKWVAVSVDDDGNSRKHLREMSTPDWSGHSPLSIYLTPNWSPIRPGEDFGTG